MSAAVESPNPFGLAILLGLNRHGKHVYGGAESPEDRAIRRRQARRDAATGSPFRDVTGKRPNRAARRALAQAVRAQDRALRRAGVGAPAVLDEAVAA